jgi:hypothetical protein
VVPHLPEALKFNEENLKLLFVLMVRGGKAVDPISVFSICGCIADHLIFRQIPVP